jgi:hypothetical protein
VKTWKRIRDKFVRELKKVNKRLSGDSGPPYRPSWEYYDVLGFLVDTVKHRRTDTNFLSQQEDANDRCRDDNNDDDADDDDIDDTLRYLSILCIGYK